ncbi:MAG: response regulator transcription factor [Actinobacteria bacterium]|nr:MAG: response regulator transcription factor [Actinomycetota bacterium]
MRVLLVEDHELYRQGLDEMLRGEGFAVVGQAGRGDDGVALALRARPDVVVMDLNLPGLPGAEATRRIVAEAPEVRVLVLTISTGSVELLDALLAGARGYLVKGAPLADLARGVRAVAAGELLLGRTVADEVLDRVRRGSPGGARPPGIGDLSERERDVLRLMAAGRDNTEIAGELQVGLTTVKHHVSNVLDKLGVENRIQAAVAAVRDGLV